MAKPFKWWNLFLFSFFFWWLWEGTEDAVATSHLAFHRTCLFCVLSICKCGYFQCSFSSVRLEYSQIAMSIICVCVYVFNHLKYMCMLKAETIFQEKPFFTMVQVLIIKLVVLWFSCFCCVFRNLLQETVKADLDFCTSWDTSEPWIFP